MRKNNNIETIKRFFDNTTECAIFCGIAPAQRTFM